MTSERQQSHTQNKEKRPPEKKKSAALSIALLAVLAAAIVGAAFLLGNYGGSGGGTAGDVQQESYASKSGFPVLLTDKEIEKAECADGNVFVLAGGELISVDSSGNVIFKYPLGFSSPVIKTGGKYCLVYDAGGHEFLLFSKLGLAYRGESEEKGKILTAAVSEDGRVLLSSRKTGSSSALTYLDKNGKMLFGWNCAKEHIVSVGISKSGGTLICAALGSASGKIYSVVNVFDAAKKQSLRKQTFKAETAVGTLLSGSDAAVIFTDGFAVFSFKSDEKPVKTEWDGKLMRLAADKSGCIAVLTQKSGSFSDCELTLFGSDGKVLFKSDVTETVKDMKIYGKKVSLLTPTELCTYSPNGDMTRTLLPAVSDGIALERGRCYLFGQGMLDKF